MPLYENLSRVERTCSSIAADLLILSENNTDSIEIVALNGIYDFEKKPLD